ncbi:AraC family transcriptional regulator [Paenibacillus macerans]|uniref:AraC family transcriptional regulator n=1 Tax=Paenibacillus macerans TaxID=44252 RepID=UPI00203E2614|nr:AraC family transcriptional regulator [Paenibacillus macerans]MCM3702118.1 AraC family transcriptional regulator [Paenibacillus macerans]
MKFFYQNWKLDPDLPMNIFRSQNISFYPHFHAEIEIIYVESGSLLIGVNEEKRQVNQGDIVICSSSDIHYFDSRDQPSQVLILLFKPEWIGPVKGWPQDFRFASPFISDKDPRFQPIKPCLDRIFRERAGARPGYQMLMKAGVLEVCGTLLRHLETRRMDTGAKEKLESRRARIQQILSYIEEHYHEELNVSFMSRQFHMEPSHFSRTFKSAIGMNFKTYLNSIRVLTAEQKLQTSDLSIMEIALECGFTSIRTFNRVFKELRGYIPSTLRNSGP